MLHQISSPVEIFSREFHRLDNDMDRLQMLMTLKSHLHRLRIDCQTLQTFCSLFHDEQYRLQAIRQLISSIYPTITSDSLTSLFELFTTTENRFHLMEILKNFELLSPRPLNFNKEAHTILLDRYRQYFHLKQIPSKQLLTLSENQLDLEPNIPIPTTSNVAKVLSNTSGVFEKAKQFVCRVFGGGSSSSASSLNEDLTNKRLVHEVEPLTTVAKVKKFRSIDDVDDLQFQPTSLPLSISQSYTSVISKSPPPSPATCSPEQPITRQSSMSFQIDQSTVPNQSMMVTQIHSILDNIDSVLDKIEAQTSTATRRSTFNENYSPIETSEDQPNTSPVQQSTDQITQTTMNFVERHLNISDGSGDTTPALLDLLDIEVDSHSSVSSEESESTMDSFQ